MAAPDGASQRVAERCGYVHEGTLRSLHFKQGLREDTRIWSRLPDDPMPEWGRAAAARPHPAQPTPE